MGRKHRDIDYYLVGTKAACSYDIVAALSARPSPNLDRGRPAALGRKGDSRDHGESGYSGKQARRRDPLSIPRVCSTIHETRLRKTHRGYRKKKQDAGPSLPQDRIAVACRPHISLRQCRRPLATEIRSASASPREQ